MKTYILLALLSLCLSPAFGNMAEPYEEGTLGARPFISQYVDVVHENLKITIDENFEYADFDIEYHIQSSKDGTQIPFLFYASEYLYGFTVSIDGVEIDILDIPKKYKQAEGTKFNDFSYFFDKETYEDMSTVLLETHSSGGFYISLSNMLYFETDIGKGKHVISVSYKASKWINNSAWWNEYSFRYALSPAKYWKSFGTLHVTIDGSEYPKPISTNITESKPITKNYGEWSFDNMPVEVLTIIYEPELSAADKLLIKIDGFWFALIVGLLITYFHFLWVRIYRKKRSISFSSVVIVGSLVVPFLFLLSWAFFYDLINLLTGPEINSSMGLYSFLVFVLYPIIMPIYWLIFWLIDKQLKK